ncbi:hypothetical protein ACN9MU_16590 [Pseudoduganella sp. R-32]|uniref:hypothetical protein n=1 Tax=Pseudoduganella sp. R-32 TaxID=3404061 RepID=UPI003CFB0BA9
MNLHDIFGLCTAPAKKAFDLLLREDRVLALGSWAHAVIHDLPRDYAFEKFLAFSILTWLSSKEKTSLCRDHLKISAVAGSTQCEQKVWQRLNTLSSRGQQDSEPSPTMELPINQEGEQK